MAARRLSMRKIKEVLRLHHEKRLSDREIAKSPQIARSTVKEYLLRAEEAKVGWPLPSELDCNDNALHPELGPTAIQTLTNPAPGDSTGPS
jgi:hypothetical protein